MADRLKVEVLTAEGQLYAGEPGFVVVPAGEGELGVLPRHVPMVATLKPGGVHVKRSPGDTEDEDILFVSGGFVEVAQLEEGEVTRVTVLADTGEHAHDIDEARAEEARKRAEQMLSQRLSGEEYAEAAALLDRSVGRIRVAEVARRRRGSRERPVRG